MALKLIDPRIFSIKIFLKQKGKHLRQLKTIFWFEVYFSVRWLIKICLHISDSDLDFSNTMRSYDKGNTNTDNIKNILRS